LRSIPQQRRTILRLRPVIFGPLPGSRPVGSLVAATNANAAVTAGVGLDHTASSGGAGHTKYDSYRTPGFHYLQCMEGGSKMWIEGRL
jgi:hypothetical protein